MSRADEHDPFEGAPATPLSPYRARNFVFQGCVESGPMRIKFYAIRRSQDAIPTAWLAQTREHIRDHVHAGAEREGDHYDLGFAVVHVGEQGVWLLMHWWAHADICCQLMASARIEGPTSIGEFQTVENPFHACVWESIVINHEHRAWVRSMLTEDPDPESYLRDVLPDGAH